jgi:hypothetical protein
MMMHAFYRELLWRQFGAALDMLDNALHACPDAHWEDAVWPEPEDPVFSQYWYIIYHTLYWTDRYLSAPTADFTPPNPFPAKGRPPAPYTREVLATYLQGCRAKCETLLTQMTAEKAAERCQFPWGDPVSYAELQLYSLRHVQEHASQLSLHLGNQGVPAPDWVAWAGE